MGELGAGSITEFQFGNALGESLLVVIVNVEVINIRLRTRLLGEELAVDLQGRDYMLMVLLLWVHQVLKTTVHAEIVILLGRVFKI